MADRIILPRALDSNGDVVSGARAYFYDTGTTNTQTVYSDSAGTTPVSQPLSADASGAFAATYTTQNAVKVDIVDSGASSLPGYPSDPHYKVPATGSAASNITFTPSTENPQTNVQDAIDELLESPDFSSITNAATVRTDLGLEIGTDVQAYDAALADIAGLTQAAGDVLFSDGTNWSNLGIGTAGQVLTVNTGATAPEWGAAGAMAFLATADASNDASLTFTQLNASLYDAYIVIGTGLIPATDSVNLLMRTSTDGGSNYDNGGTDYQYLVLANTFGGIATNATSTGAGSIQINGTAAVGSAAGEYGVNFVMHIMMPHMAVPTAIEWRGSYMDTITRHIQIGSGTAVRDAAEDVDAFGFLFSSGNIESGSITLWGLRNS